MDPLPQTVVAAWALVAYAAAFLVLAAFVLRRRACRDLSHLLRSWFSESSEDFLWQRWDSGSVPRRGTKGWRVSQNSQGRNSTPSFRAFRRPILKALALWVLLLSVVTALWSSSLFAPPGRASTAYQNCPTSVTWKANLAYANGEFCLSLGTDLLVYQTDGNLVYYVSGLAVWSSGTYGVGATLALQGDGNVVIYSANNKAVYASYWYFDHAVYTTPDANKYLYLVYYGHNHVIANNWGTATATGYSALSGVQWRDFGTQSACTVETEPIWEYYPARTLAPGALCWSNPYGTLVFQTDGNFVEYVDGRARWNSGTSGRGAVLAFQSDGNIVIYSASGKPLWAVSFVAQKWRPQDLTHFNGTLRLEVQLDHKITYNLFDNSGTGALSYWVY